jgi:hypothetical protein
MKSDCGDSDSGASERTNPLSRVYLTVKEAEDMTDFESQTMSIWGPNVDTVRARRHPESRLTPPSEPIVSPPERNAARSRTRTPKTRDNRFPTSVDPNSTGLGLYTTGGKIRSWRIKARNEDKPMTKTSGITKPQLKRPEKTKRTAKPNRTLRGRSRRDVVTG